MTRAPVISRVVAATNATKKKKVAWQKAFDLQKKSFQNWQRAEATAHESTRRAIHAFRLIFPDGQAQNDSTVNAKVDLVSEAYRNASSELYAWKAMLPKIKQNVDSLIHELHELHDIEAKATSRIQRLKKESTAPPGTMVLSAPLERLHLDLSNAIADRDTINEKQKKLWTRLKDAEYQFDAARNVVSVLTDTKVSAFHLGTKAKIVQEAGASKHVQQMRLTQKLHDLDLAIKRKKKLADLAEKMYDSALRQLQIASTNTKKANDDDRDSLIVQAQEESDRKERAAGIINQTRAEIKSLEDRFAAVKKEAEDAGAKFPTLVSTWALAERQKKLRKRPADTGTVQTVNKKLDPVVPAVQEASMEGVQ